MPSSKARLLSKCQADWSIRRRRKLFFFLAHALFTAFLSVLLASRPLLTRHRPRLQAVAILAAARLDRPIRSLSLVSPAIWAKKPLIARIADAIPNFFHGTATPCIILKFWAISLALVSPIASCYTETTLVILVCRAQSIRITMTSFGLQRHLSLFSLSTPHVPYDALYLLSMLVGC